jgi:hypothetical protein
LLGGTLGPLVQGAQYILSNSHVLAGDVVMAATTASDPG